MIKRLSILLLSALTLSSVSSTQVYLCANEQGKQQYSDVPCGHDAKTYTAKEPATKFKEVKINKTSMNKSDAKNRQAATNNDCPFFSHTQLRSLRVKETFQRGLPMKVISTRYGNPDERDETGENKETWKYKGERLNREFKFKHGCLVSWKEKWTKSKTYFKKYKN